MKMIIPFLFFLILGTVLVSGATSYNFLTKGYGDTLYCHVDESNCNFAGAGGDSGIWILENLIEINTTKTGGVDDVNITGELYVEGTVGNRTDRYTWAELNATGSGGGDNMTADNFFGNFWGGTGNFSNVSISENLDVSGNASFNGSFSTPCLHCEDGDVYFHGDGYFEGNVTADNIEIMESLIVHGESSCSGVADKCNTFLTSATCGDYWSGQRECYWFLGGCRGTERACADMALSTCEEQLSCVLITTGDGFVFDSSGFNGSFNLTTTGNVTANEFFGLFNWFIYPDVSEFYLNFNKTHLQFDESKLNDTIDNRLASTTYYPDWNLTTGATVTGNITSVLTPKDGLTYNISEQAGQKFYTYYNFSNVKGFTSMLFRLQYDGTHDVHIGLYDYDDDEYEEEYGKVSQSDDYYFLPISVWDSTDHISGTNEVSLRFYHDDNGKNNEYLRIDYISLIDGYSTTTNDEHDGTTGRDNKNNHPWALPIDGTRAMTGNLTPQYNGYIWIGNRSNWWYQINSYIFNSTLLYTTDIIALNDISVEDMISVGTGIAHKDDIGGNTYQILAEDVTYWVIGGEALLSLVESTQDYVKIGDGGDVIINHNDNLIIDGATGTSDFMGNPIINISSGNIIGDVNISGNITLDICKIFTHDSVWYKNCSYPISDSFGECSNFSSGVYTRTSNMTKTLEDGQC